jgi:hypothetical protein
MIAKLSDPFGLNTALKMKIDYHISKIEKGVASVLFNSTGENHLNNLYQNMLMVSGLNDRVKGKYIEVSLNLSPGENLSDDRFLQLTQEYLMRMGYDNACYAVIRHTDKDHSHVHVLSTRIDMDGRAINDSFSHRKSQEISRKLEIEYGLQVTQYNQFNNKALGEMKAREYYFHNALQKAMRSKISKGAINTIFSESTLAGAIDFKKARTNTEYEIILGSDLYHKVGEILEKNNHFNPIYKDELLKVMDRLHVDCQSAQEFRTRLETEGYYMRMVTEKGQSHYVYGIPAAGIYFKDRSFPQKYRYGHMQRNPMKLSEDEQLHYIYNHAFLSLHASSTYDEFCHKMAAAAIDVKMLVVNGIDEISFVMNDVDNGRQFNASEVSERLTHANIQKYFAKEETLIDLMVKNEVVVSNLQEDIDHYRPLTWDGQSSRSKEDEDELGLGKKKKKKDKDKDRSS